MITTSRCNCNSVCSCTLTAPPNFGSDLSLTLIGNGKEETPYVLSGEDVNPSSPDYIRLTIEAMDTLGVTLYPRTYGYVTYLGDIGKAEIGGFETVNMNWINLPPGGNIDFRIYAGQTSEAYFALPKIYAVSFDCSQKLVADNGITWDQFEDFSYIDLFDAEDDWSVETVGTDLSFVSEPDTGVVQIISENGGCYMCHMFVNWYSSLEV